MEINMESNRWKFWSRLLVRKNCIALYGDGFIRKRVLTTVFATNSSLPCTVPHFLSHGTVEDLNCWRNSGSCAKFQVVRLLVWNAVLSIHMTSGKQNKHIHKQKKNPSHLCKILFHRVQHREHHLPPVQATDPGGTITMVTVNGRSFTRQIKTKDTAVQETNPATPGQIVFGTFTIPVNR